MNNDFHKASYITALNINRLSVGSLNKLAHTFAKIRAEED